MVFNYFSIIGIAKIRAQLLDLDELLYLQSGITFASPLSCDQCHLQRKENEIVRASTKA